MALISEQVTFGDSGLDRAAHLRADPDAQAAALQAAESRAILFCKGDLLCADGTPLRLPMNHPLVRAGRTRIFLGLDAGAAVFAVDVTALAPGAEAALPDLPEGAELSDLRAVMTGLTPREAELAATARALFSWHDSHGFCARCGTASEVTDAGWQRRCPACGAPHFPRTDPVVIMLVTCGNDVLLGRSPVWPEGMYSLLAGFVEPGETIGAAVAREVMEEAGVPVADVRYQLDQPWPFPNSLMFGCTARATAREITLDPVELEDALWLPREDLLKVCAGDHPFIKPPRRGAIAEFLLRNWLADRLV